MYICMRVGVGILSIIYLGNFAMSQVSTEIVKTPKDPLSLVRITFVKKSMVHHFTIFGLVSLEDINNLM